MNARGVISVVTIFLVCGCDATSERTPTKVLRELAWRAPGIKLRQEACDALARKGGDEATTALLEMLDDKVLWHCAVQGLVALKAQSAVGPLLERARRSDERSHFMIVALGEIGDCGVLKDLDRIKLAAHCEIDGEQRICDSLTSASLKIQNRCPVLGN